MPAADERPFEIVDLWSNDPDYRRQFQREAEVDETVRLLELEESSLLADVGCGNGTFAVAAARSGCSVVALDALASAVAACARAAAGAGVAVLPAVARAEALPLADGSVDRVLCRAVLHHVPDADAAYAEMGRVLRPGGLLVLQTPCNNWDEPFGETISDLWRLMDPTHRRTYHTPGSVITGLARAGVGRRRADGWPYEFPTLSDAHADFVRRRGAAERLRLRRRTEGDWAVDLCWLRVVGVRIDPPPP